MSTTNNNSHPVEARNLTRHFGRLTAVDSVSFSVAPGSVFALLGRNGSGKSTIVRCLLGQLRPQSGGTTVFGLDSWQDRMTIMQRTGVVPETPDIPPEMTADALTRFAARTHPTFDEAEYRARLHRFSIATNRAFKTLSKGQQKQVSLALALATAPALLVLDDPTLGLDAVARKALFDELIGELADRGTTVLITTHDMAAVEGVVDRVGIIQGGRMVLDEAFDGLRARFRRLHLPRAAASDEIFRKIHQTAGGLEPRAVGDSVTTVLSRFDPDTEASLEDLNLQIENMGLEDIFITVCETEEGALS